MAERLGFERVGVTGYDSRGARHEQKKGKISQLEEFVVLVQWDDGSHSTWVDRRSCRRLKKKDPTIWLNADHIDNMRDSNEPRSVNASPFETRAGQRWRAYRPVKCES